jgi:hypothetical protein
MPEISLVERDQSQAVADSRSGDDGVGHTQRPARTFAASDQIACPVSNVPVQVERR